MRFKNLISVLFAVVIVFIALPMTVSAADYDSEVEITSSTDTVTIAPGKKVRLYTNVPTSSTNTINIVIQEGAFVYFDAELEYNGIPENYFIAFSGSGSLEINDSTITGTSNQPLIWINSTISSALIKESRITSFSQALFTESITTIDNSIIESTYTNEHSEVTTVAATNSLLIKGAETEIKSSTSADKSGGITFVAENGLLEIRDGYIFGTDSAIHHEAGDIKISGGRIEAYPDVPDYNALGAVYLRPQEHPNYSFTMTGGSIYSKDESAICIAYEAFMLVNISGGNITGNSGICTYSVVSSAPYTNKINVSGGTLTGTTESGIIIQDNTELTISGGTFKGDLYGVRIVNSSATLTVSPATSKSVTIQGNTSAIEDSAITPNYNSIRYSETSTNNSGSGAAAAYHPAQGAFVNNSSYKYIKAISGYAVTVTGGTANGLSSTAAAPGSTVNITPTILSGNAFIGWTASGVTLSNPTISTQSFIMPFNDVVLTANYEGIIYNPRPPELTYYSPGYEYAVPEVSHIYDRYVLVIATLNESGTVNSTKTVEDMTEAHRKAVAENISKIYLKIPTGGKGISNSAMKAVYKAAGGTKLFLTFGFYELKDNGTHEEDIGTFFFPLNDKSGQILTGITFGTTHITNIENYIVDKWNTGVLGSFETTHKGGWGESATVSMSIDKLDFIALENANVYALIYDTKAKKFYQSKAKIKDGFVTFNTSRSGIVTIVTKSVK
jgi:hypothetical protein